MVLLTAVPSFAQQTTTPPSSTPGSNSDSQTIGPPASQSISKPELPDSPSASQPQQPPQQNSATNAQAQTQQPSGTAAAQQGRVSGSTLSEPAGVAIAPAKQKRTRSILIKMGLIAGAGIALGTVAALSAGSPSKPPGAQ
ncbi:MAG TPA: hypothetical protein VGF44_02545 [Terriglobales bacterium]